MSTPIKIRSDYHDLYISSSTGFSALSRWIKPLFWLTLGIIIGMLYNQKQVEDLKHSMMAAVDPAVQTIAPKEARIAKA